MHITTVASGSFVRIKLKARTQMVYHQIAQDGYNLKPGEPKKRDRTWGNSLLSGGVIINDTVNGIIKIGVQNQQGPPQVYTAEVPYTGIAMLHVGVVYLAKPTTPEYLKGTTLPPRIKYTRVVL